MKKLHLLKLLPIFFLVQNIWGTQEQDNKLTQDYYCVDLIYEEEGASYINPSILPGSTLICDVAKRKYLGEFPYTSIEFRIQRDLVKHPRTLDTYNTNPYDMESIELDKFKKDNKTTLGFYLNSIEKLVLFKNVKMTMNSQSMEFILGFYKERLWQRGRYYITKLNQKKKELEELRESCQYIGEELNQKKKELEELDKSYLVNREKKVKELEELKNILYSGSFTNY